MARRRTPVRNFSEGDIVDRLAARYGPPAYAFLPQVRDSTGAVAARTADAIAMSLWPSRGLVLHGFEIKVTRADWHKELHNPAKAEMIAQFCDFWWLVVADKNIVRPGELPDAWGLLSPYGKGLRADKEPTKQDVEAVDRPFLAAILRRAAQDCPYANRRSEEYKRGIEDGKKETNWNRDHTASDLKALRKSVSDFEEASGIKLDCYGYRSTRLGEAARFLVDHPNFADTADQVATTVETQAKNARRVADALKAMNNGEVGDIMCAHEGASS